MTTQGADDREPDERAAHHLPLAGSLVREVLRRTPAQLVEDDLYAAALTALVDADADFDPVHDAPYDRYVTARIRAGMFEELRSVDWEAHDLPSVTARTTAARDRLHTVLDRFGDRAQALAALDGEIPGEPEATSVADTTDLPYLRAALAELPPHPDLAAVDVHLLRAESLAALRASLMTRHEDETRALAGLDAVAAAVRASRVSFASGRVELDVVEHAEPDGVSASTNLTA
ncbi:hypothetical protein [Nocardioides mangrovi]|uniref:Sigma-70 family RNA polymerase sigma factor n=1 Tax=Nocardioides mangrovi TaxID=2874580 RepID=A0ABS7UGV8_9ACTN|nr:hypothetical protein [Nocardioides mangrovi]MBZ5740070.1 hypothetical protein [Nocardioides mangrovi]